MAKLYPPYIEGTLPAFSVNCGDGNGAISIPFAHNRAVSIEEINGYSIKIKTVQNDILIATLNVNDLSNIPVRNFILQGSALKVNIGQYYKIQVAYRDKEKGEVGYYSTVGVIKCTSTPEVIILNLDEGNVSNSLNHFVGQYRQPAGGDVSEKVYSSIFTITDSEGNIIETTGNVLHNVENNTKSYLSTDTMNFNRDLEFGKIYKIKYEITTNNGLVVSSPVYQISQQKSVAMELKGELRADANYDDGYADINIIGYKDNGAEEVVSGNFILSREDSSNPGVWEELTRFSLNYEFPTKTIFRDFTVEQGKTYTYSLQQWNRYGVYSSRKKSNAVYIDFEDVYLYDGQYQLKIRFNPQVSSFKTQLSETRLETIGGKYPFFFRNSIIGYKTFPITGLISMLSDSQHFFATNEEILKEDFTAERHSKVSDKKLMPHVYDHTDLIAQNFTSERLFKLKVLDWLNNGEVKLFRSQAEGNYLVRLMETSLTPENGLGRMLHNLSTTAYECAECNYDNMVKYNIIHNDATIAKNSTSYVTMWREVSIFDDVLKGRKDFEGWSENLLVSDLDPSETYTTMVRINDVLPGTTFRLSFSPNGDIEKFVVGNTGNYYIEDIKPIYGIYLDLTSVPKDMSGSILYQYKVPVRNEFNSIEGFEPNIRNNAQFIGPCENLRNSLENTKEQVTKISTIRFFKRPVEYIYTNKIENWGNELDWFNRNSYEEEGYYYSLNQNAPKFYLDIDDVRNDRNQFTHKSSELHSPFGLYVIRDVFYKEVDLTEHLKYHENNLFERYFIDRVLHETMADDKLALYSSSLIRKKELDKKAKEDLTQEEKDELEAYEDFFKEEGEFLYVLDPCAGKIYRVGPDSFVYDCSFTFKGDKIDLKEQEYYTLNNLEPEEANIKIGSGLYGDVYYHNVTISYTFENQLQNEWQVYQNALNNSSARNLQNINIIENAYANYNTKLAQLKEEWTKKDGEE